MTGSAHWYELCAIEETVPSLMEHTQAYADAQNSADEWAAIERGWQAVAKYAAERLADVTANRAK